MKKSTLRRLLLLCLCLTLVSVSLIGGTLAKYTTTVSGKGTATAAAFSFTAKNGNDSYAATAAEVNLFATANVTNDTASNVASGKIAPGATGYFPITINAEASEVDVVVSYVLSMGENSTCPFKFAISDSTTAPTTVNSDLSALQTALNSNETVNAYAQNATGDKTVYVHWVWAHDDTNDISVQSSSWTLTITATASQKVTESTPSN